MVAVRKQQGSQTIEKDFAIDWSNTYSLLECCGCEEISVKRTSWFSEDPDYESVEYYPTRVSRRQPPWLEDIPEASAELMREIYGALQGDQRRLALMGARTVIDGLLLRQVGDSGTFAERLDALEDKGFLSQDQSRDPRGGAECGPRCSPSGLQSGYSQSEPCHGHCRKRASGREPQRTCR